MGAVINKPGADRLVNVTPLDHEDPNASASNTFKGPDQQIKKQGVADQFAPENFLENSTQKGAENLSRSADKLLSQPKFDQRDDKGKWVHAEDAMINPENGTMANKGNDAVSASFKNSRPDDAYMKAYQDATANAKSMGSASPVSAGAQMTLEAANEKK